MLKETKLIIYACPMDVLNQQLKQTFKQIELECGINKAHYYFPHITLCSFFSLPDKENIPLLIRALDESIQTYSLSSSTCMQDVKLQGTQPMDQMIKISTSCQYLEALLSEFSQKAHRILGTSIKIKPANSHHLSIAYGYNIADHPSILRIIRDKISIFRDGNTPKYNSNSSWNTSQWEICLYEPPPDNIKLGLMKWEAICKLWVNHYKRTLSR